MCSSDLSTQTLGVVNTFICESEPWSHFVAIELITPKMTAGANPKLRSQAGKAVVLRVALQECKSNAALKREQEQMLVSQWGRSPIGQVSLSLLARLLLLFHVGCG